VALTADVDWRRLTGVTGRELASSGISVYGPRTTITLALAGVEGAHEFLLIDDFTARHGNWVKTNSFYSVG
jgi:sedoheptulose-bisphosphatase